MSAPPPAAARIEIAFQGWWLSGTGGGAGAATDTRCHRDSRGLPALPMSQVKGTLREMAERMLEPTRVTALFGGRAQGPGGPPADEGALVFEDDARLPEALAAALLDKGLGAALFARLSSTAIDDATGAARDRTLRTDEVVVPVTLHGIVSVRPGAEVPVDWVEVLDSLCAATLAFGRHKTDGLGRAIARAVPFAPPAPAAKDAPRGRCLDIVLTQRHRAVFSARPATEGAHATLAAPTGSALLGWCAAAAGYADFADPTAVFHTGAVRFGDALPDPGTGEEVVPIPRSFAAPKSAMAAATAGGRIDRTLVRNGKPPADATRPEDGGGDTQYEALQPGWMTPGYALATVRRGQRLRTAMAGGAAAPGQLFGYEHLEPGEGQRFRARLEIDPAVAEEDVARIVAAFHGRRLSLGRGRATGYGGGFDSEVVAAAAAEGTLPAGTTGRIAVLALSDLAPVNAWGAPAPVPSTAALGLDGARFLPGESAVAHRRFAPWNRHLGGRDTERLVVAAGSVLVFDLAAPLTRTIPARRTIGLWREAGLGRVWIAPPFLAAHHLPDAAPPPARRAAADPAPPPEPAPPPLDAQDAALLGWCRARVAGGPA